MESCRTDNSNGPWLIHYPLELDIRHGTNSRNDFKELLNYSAFSFNDLNLG